MSARILIVDDIAVNRRLLEARLRAEYYEVATAASGEEALSLCERTRFDLVLLDVMMPDMDGYEVCRRLKASLSTQHVPVVLITALDQPDDRLAGLAAGADDFLTKPVGNFALFARLRSLTRLKFLTDEIHTRLDVVAEATMRRDLKAELATPGTDGAVLLVGDDPGKVERLRRVLKDEQRVETATTDIRALETARDGHLDLVVVDLSTRLFDPLRLCSQIRSAGATRRTPILLVAQDENEPRLQKGMEIGANDYLTQPVNCCELLVRTRTQIRRRRFDETLRRSVKHSTEMAVRDPLTDLYNRRFMESALSELVIRARAERKPLSILIADIDHFKRVNDGWGHEAGDCVLRQFAQHLGRAIRGTDVACRYGGEEFVVLMQDTERAEAEAVGERLRQAIASSTFEIGGEMLRQTVSVGLATLTDADDPASLLKRADRGLYAAKRQGRNQVIALAA